MAEQDVALVIVGHGSAKAPESSRSTRDHARTLKGRFAEVHVAFWKEKPFLTDVLDKVKAREVRIVPNLVCKGQVSSQVIPREMGLTGPVTERDGRRFVLCDPVGEHPRIPELVATWVQAVILSQGLKPEETCLILVGHGSSRNDESLIRTTAVALALAKEGLSAQVRTAYLEQEPRICDWARLTAARHVIVLPFMISYGLHGAEDIPACLGLDPADPALARMASTGDPAGPFEREGRQLWYLRAVGHHPAIAGIIADLALGV